MRQHGHGHGLVERRLKRFQLNAVRTRLVDPPDLEPPLPGKRLDDVPVGGEVVSLDHHRLAPGSGVEGS